MAAVWPADLPPPTELATGQQYIDEYDIPGQVLKKKQASRPKNEWIREDFIWFKTINSANGGGALVLQQRLPAGVLLIFCSWVELALYWLTVFVKPDTKSLVATLRVKHWLQKCLRLSIHFD